MVKDRPENTVDGPQTNVGDVDGLVLSGQFPGPLTINYNSRSAPFRLPVQKPPRPEKFVGRDDELTDLLRDLQPEKKVTICGPGGIGKTALIAEAIWRLVPDNNPPAKFPDGLIFHDFYRQPQSATALEAIARAFGEDLRPGLSVAARRALAGRQALLILDGTEAADDLDAVLDIAGSCCVLITTHNHSDAPAEWSDLNTLPPKKAVQLFQEWGKEWASDDAVSNRICELLGGLPLGIFLAGRYLVQHRQQAAEYLAWLKETPLEALDMGERLHKSFPLLMERSLERVSEMGRSALGMTGILSLEPFDSKLIQVALSVKPRVANQSLGELANCGLLQRPTAQYQVAHALIRTYAKKRLVPKRSALSRLAKYYFGFVRTQCRIGLSGYTCLDSHRNHILALQSACLDASEWKPVRTIAWAMKEYLDLQGHWSVRVSILKNGLIAACAANDRYDEGAFLSSLGLTYNYLGECHQAKDLLEQSIFIAQEIKDRVNEGAALTSLATTCNLLGEHEKAIELCDQALLIAGETKNNDLMGAAFSNIGIAYHYLGDNRRAIDFFERDLAIVQEKGKISKEANVLCCLGVAYSQLGENHHAIELYDRYLTIARETGNRLGEGNCLCNMGSSYNSLGDSFKAIKLHERSLDIFRELGHRLGEGNALFNMGLALNKINEREKAIECVKSALNIFKKIESPQIEKARRMLAEWGKKED